MADKWYDSVFGRSVGLASILIATTLGGAAIMRGCSDAFDPSSSQVRLEEAKNKKYSVQEADLNGNGIKDSFYVIEGKIAIVELDGKPIVKYLDSKFLTK